MVKGLGGVGNAQSAKASSIVLMLSLLLHRHAVPLKITCNHVNLLTSHNSTDGEDELLGNASLPGVDVAYLWWATK